MSVQVEMRLCIDQRASAHARVGAGEGGAGGVQLGTVGGQQSQRLLSGGTAKLKGACRQAFPLSQPFVFNSNSQAAFHLLWNK
jgi:hypothetical protein